MTRTKSLGRIAAPLLLMAASLLVTAPAAAVTRDQLHDWLSSGWEETDADGNALPAKPLGIKTACGSRDLPAFDGPKPKGRGIRSFYSEGVLGFGTADGKLVAISNYARNESGKIDHMYTKASTLGSEVVIGPQRDYRLKLEGEIAGLGTGFTVIPVTSHRFRLQPDAEGAAARYFKRCGV